MKIVGFGVNNDENQFDGAILDLRIKLAKHELKKVDINKLIDNDISINTISALMTVFHAMRENGIHLNKALEYIESGLVADSLRDE